jgi:diaminohydroxyphosphoribosylaminopyrimidine deaminase/5-amino-6-(5-phosphoribosylamino)uracil reductase
VLVRGGRVVGRGWHRAYGGPHAEVSALRSAGPRARGATAYVSLEPCSTTGKTGPCTEALARAGVVRVVWAMDDWNPPNARRAASLLSRGGVAVDGNVLPEAGERAVRALRRGGPRRRPWTIAKWAMSLDGRISPARGQGGRLSGPQALRWLHDLRGRVEAVAVGVGTVLSDDPRLTCRRPGGPPHGRPQPLRVVFDSRLRTPPSAACLRSASEDAPVLLVHARVAGVRRLRLERPGVEFLEAGDRRRVDLAAALARLWDRGVRRLLVEGGGEVLGALAGAGLVDQVFCVATPLLLGGKGAPTPLADTGVDSLAEATRLSPLAVRRLGADVLLQAYATGVTGDARS